ncbi:Hemolymph lipopolysaccharide-binding protein, partial [Trichinella pseudospiralis]
GFSISLFGKRRRTSGVNNNFFFFGTSENFEHISATYLGEPSETRGFSAFQFIQTHWIN